MKQLHIKSLCKEVIVIQLPEGANRLKVFNDDGRPYLSYFVNVVTYREYLPEGAWNEPTPFNQVTEEQFAELVDGNNGGDADTMFYDYTAPKTCFFCFTKSTAPESFISAIEAAGWCWGENPNGNKPIRFVPFKSAGRYTDNDYAAIDKYKKDLADWEQAQAKTFDPERTVLIIKK